MSRSPKALATLACGCLLFGLLGSGLLYWVSGFGSMSDVALLKLIQPVGAPLESEDALTPTDVVELYVSGKGGSTYFRIPKDYLSFALNWAGGEQEAIEIAAFLPDMRPLSVAVEGLRRQGLDAQEIRSKIAGNAVYIYLDAGWEFTASKLQQNSVLPSEMKIEFPIVSGLYYLGRQPNNHFGEVGRTFGCRGGGGCKDIEVFGNPQRDYYVPVQHVGGMFIYCLFHEEFPNGRCNMTKDIRSNLWADIKFPRAALDEWRVIESASDNLINGFIK